MLPNVGSMASDPHNMSRCYYDPESEMLKHPRSQICKQVVRSPNSAPPDLVVVTTLLMDGVMAVR